MFFEFFFLFRLNLQNCDIGRTWKHKGDCTYNWEVDELKNIQKMNSNCLKLQNPHDEFF